MTPLQYVSVYSQPIIGLCAGISIFAFIAYMNWYGDIKQRSVARIALTIFGDHPLALKSADDLFMAVTSILLTISGILIILALGFLTAGPPIL